MDDTSHRRSVQASVDSVLLEGELSLPAEVTGLVVFAHGSGSSRLSPRNNWVARSLRQAKLATFLFDLLTPEEDRAYETRFDIDLLTRRLIGATRWVREQSEVRDLGIGYFGSSTGAAAALKAAAVLGPEVRAVVSRGGRPDLALEELDRVEAPTLLIVGGLDHPVLELNQQAFARLKGEKDLAIVSGATHLFEEPGALERVAELAASWFIRHLGRRTPSP